MTRGRRERRILPAILALVGALPACAGSASGDLERQRELFEAAYPEVERGNWSVVEALPAADAALLSEYLLWPDLRAAFFRADIDKADRSELESFLDRYGTLRPARDLRYRYALALAAAGEHAAYLDLYRAFYQGMGVAKLDCHALDAEIALGNGAEVVERAIGLWMTGQSQDSACDPVFRFLANEDHLTPEHYRERFDLAIGIRAFTRARWLARSIDAEHETVATRWIRAQDDPAAFVAASRQLPEDETSARQLAYAVERLAYGDPGIALEHWRRLSSERSFPDELAASTARHIALWAARDGLPGARALLVALPDLARNAEVLRWRARTALRESDWAAVLEDISLMPAGQQDAEEWRYWRGLALRKSDDETEDETGDGAQGERLLRELATERSFYGFLAADELGLDYSLGHAAIPADEAVIARLAARDDFARARELFLVGLDSHGRSEWDSALALLSAAEKLQAARLADRWGWHSRAIATAASVGEFDDLSIRYPLPYPDVFAKHARAASIDPTWAYGIARSESLFMRDVRSSAGAIGLMQLMPTTGRRVARRISLPYSGLATLTDPDGNIRLGTTYLGEMADRYAGNRVLATAAYNAGPLRVDEWLPRDGSVDTRVWIETIPFNETRRYVRRVLAAETIFHWRMTGELRRLSDSLPPVIAPGAQTLASTREAARPATGTGSGRGTDQGGNRSANQSAN